MYGELKHFDRYTLLLPFYKKRKKIKKKKKGKREKSYFINQARAKANASADKTVGGPIFLSHNTPRKSCYILDFSFIR